MNFEWYRTSQGKTTLYIDCTYIIVVSLQCELFNVLCYSHNREKTQAALKFFPADATNQGRSSLGKKSKMPPLLVQRCNGTTAGLGYLEVLELSMHILLLGQLASVRTATTNGGEGYNSHTDFNPNTISHQYSSNPTSSRQKQKQNPNRNVVCINLLPLSTSILYLYLK